MDIHSIIVAKDTYVYREEYDDWALLFNPNSAETYGMNQISSFIYKHLNGENSVKSIIIKLSSECQSVPPDIESIVIKFLKSLVAMGMAEIKK